jgi:hypothetical protein
MLRGGIMARKFLFFCFLSVVILCGCSAPKKEMANKPKEFAGSRLAAQVFNRWNGDQRDAQKTRLEALEQVQGDQVQDIHETISKVRYKY